ncbi:histidine ammonia-lyase [Staphylospora marina]|uniref:histidine ammonia-lyase n=1 Tax=Staphylospora marina TaxID=2490858 RepID=UPI003B967779
MTKNATVVLTGSQLGFDDFDRVVHGRAKVALSDEALLRMEESSRYVQHLILENRTVYGVNTGFGKLCDTVIPPEETRRLQRNLIISHACGTGEPLPEEVVRGMMLLRINALAKGFSGVRPSTVRMMAELLNEEVHPIVPSQGSLGASGDLAPLAHMCLPLLGLGEVMHKGVKKPAARVLRELGLVPLELEAKEGLALINGTQMMCSLMAHAVIRARQLLLAADIISAMTMEALEGIPHACHPRLHLARGHRGQIVTASNLLKLLKGSLRVTEPGEKRVQDAYSLRCIPQVHGASKDAFRHVREIVLAEMNAATDNPLIFADEDEVISGGNFHGQPLALASDYLAMAMSEIANISERRTERLVNPTLSGLPPFLSKNSGLESGYMIMQYTAASLVSENKSLCHPASVDSIPSSANQEDHVSMGSISARKCMRIIRNSERVLAIEYLCAGQALEFRTGQSGIGTECAWRLLRRVVPPLEHDREGHADIQAATELLTSGELVKAVTGRVELEV